MFVATHVLLAARTNVPELMMSPEEGKMFMDAAQNVLRHYSVETTQKTLDWIAFAGVAAQLYGTRAAAVMIRRKQERSDNRSTGNVRPFPRPVETVAPTADEMAAAIITAGGHEGISEDGF